MAGTLGRVYGGDPTKIHIKDGGRKQVGDWMADFMDTTMREQAYENGSRAWEESRSQKLCPGCYMVAGYDMLVTLAKRNGQDLGELARSMIGAFQHLRDNPIHPYTEEIEVILDNPQRGEK